MGVEELISVAQLAERWGMGRSTIYDLIRRPHDPLPAYKIGAVRINPHAAQEWLNRQKTNID